MNHNTTFLHAGLPAGRIALTWCVMAACGLGVATLSPASARAQGVRDTLRLADATALARAESPMLVAVRREADAATARVAPAGALPDPVLTLGLMNRPINGFGADERMTMNQIQLTQEFPWPGTLGAVRLQADHLARADASSAEETEAALINAMQQRYFELASIDRSLTVLTRTRDLLRNFFDVSTAMYAVGDVPQQDVLQAQVAVARMTEEIVVLTQQRLAGGARLNAFLGRDATVPVPALELPAIGGPLPSLDTLMARAREARPAIAAAEARRRAAEAGIRSAERQRYPAFMVGAAWSQRPAFDDMASLMVGIRLPVRPNARQRPLRLEMESMEASAAAMTTELTNQTWADLVEARADAERARSLGELYATAILPQSHAAVEAALSAYRVGTVNYMTLVEGQMTVNRYQLEFIRITAQYHQAVARITALVGGAGGVP